MALTALKKQQITCTDDEIKTFYTKMYAKLNWIKSEIRRNEQEFENYPIKNHPATNAVTLAILETRTQPTNCTAFCKKASQAYDLLAEHVIKIMITRLRKDTPTMKELIMQYSQLYESTIIAYNKAREQNK